MNSLIHICFKRTLLYLLFITIYSNAYSQLIPDFEMSFSVVSPLGKDSVTIGLSTAAGKGYDQGLDIIDTSALQLPVDLRIYDPEASQHIGDNCKHFSTSYQQFPANNTREIIEFERIFTLVLRIDLEQIDQTTSRGNSCVDPQVTDEGTYLHFDLNPLYNYQFINSVGYQFDVIEITPSSGYLVAIDGYYWLNLISPDEFCLVLLPSNSRSNPACNVDLFFDVKLWVSNKLYVDTEATLLTPKITTLNNKIVIESGNLYNSISLYDLHGKQLIQHHLNGNKVILDISPYGRQMYVLRLSNSNNSHYLIHKLIFAFRN